MNNKHWPFPLVYGTIPGSQELTQMNNQKTARHSAVAFQPITPRTKQDVLDLMQSNKVYLFRYLDPATSRHIIISGSKILEAGDIHYEGLGWDSLYAVVQGEIDHRKKNQAFVESLQKAIK